MGLPCAHEHQATQTQDLILVFPNQAGKNQVRWWEFDWHFTEWEPVPDAAPVRLYFYQDLIVPWARAFTNEVYREYVEDFGYRPRRLVPYLLYNSHFEFQSTTAFFISERVLGVTDVRDLTMALPYWGDHARFRHILRHEMAHQFTIQKVVDAALAAQVPNPLQLIPLWYIEGVAEFFSQEALTPEVRAVLADSVRAAPDDPHLGLPRFFDQGPLSFERVYLIGHAQTRFLEEEFGPGTNRRIHEATPDLTRGMGGFGAFSPRPPITFAILLSRVVGVEPDEIERRWLAWVRRITDPALAAEADRPPMNEITDLGRGEIDSLSVSPDGRTMVYRTFDPMTGRTRLFIEDLRDPSSRQLVAEDQTFGLDTLHGLDRRVTALDDQMVVYIGRSSDADDLFVRTYRREERDDGRIRFRLSGARRHDLSREFPLIESGYPTIHPQDQSVAFLALNRQTAVINVYSLSDPRQRGSPVTQVTHTPDTKRDLNYALDGTLVLSADATPDRSFELFRVTPGGRLAAMTLFPGGGGVRHPAPDGLGGLVFTADATGFTQAYRLLGGRVTRLTAAATYLAQPGVTAEGDLLGLTLMEGRRRLVRIAREDWLDVAVDAVPAEAVAARPLPEDPPTEIEPYRPGRLSNYRLADARGFLAGGQFAAGLVSFTDLFRSRIFGASVQYIGGLDWLDVQLFYLNRTHRLAWGLAGLVDTGIQIQPDEPDALETFLLQRAGASFQLQYPLSRQMRLEAFLLPHALRAYRFSAPGAFSDRNEGTYPALQAGMRFGLDTLRFLMPIGPFDGTSVLLDVEGTALLGDVQSFGRVGLSLNTFRPLFRDWKRFYFHGRITAGSTLGGPLGEQYLLPSAYNHRGFPANAFLEIIGRHYYLLTGELRFPLDFALPFLPFFEGLVGLDVGAIGFELDEMYPRRLAAAVLGLNFGLGPAFSVRLHFARPFDIGGIDPGTGWLTHFSLSTPIFLF